jgi:transposase-like protein
MNSLDLVGSFSNLWTEITCPSCKISNRTRLKEILIESSIICRGCYKDYHLVQADASGSRSTRRIKSLEEEINNITKNFVIDIKL